MQYRFEKTNSNFQINCKNYKDSTEIWKVVSILFPGVSEISLDEKQIVWKTKVSDLITFNFFGKI